MGQFFLEISLSTLPVITILDINCVMAGNRTRDAEFSVTSTIHYTMRNVAEKCFSANCQKCLFSVC